jgi:anti-sigma factor (TIGR02949 family)
MTCDDALVLVHALADGELDAGHARAVETHLASCRRCATELAGAHEIKRVLAATNLRFAAPASLRSRIEGAIPKARPVASRRTLLKGFALGSAMSALAASGIGVVVLREARESRVMGDAISAHLRSLQGEHLTDVLSSNQHTVKPWFNGKLDLAPPVPDLTTQGFTLIGGRLDFLDGKPVAALVYRRRAHVINVFVGQGLGAAPASRELQVMQGFNLLRWRDGELSVIAVSDLNREELDEFQRKFAAAEAAG